uniref:Deoxynucleoside kinase domain-containing protein n=1 Tax=Timema tahoe TaxID=61484 RepID=A0A7R9FGX1_9NEOP|nr:unnamed protein product [Timema tahoe]
MRPHLVVYLDVPAAVVAERIKQRNIPYEVNSKLMNEKYLANIEELYKQRYLKEISTHAELLVYDWSNYGDIETVVEDIERVDFDCFGKYDPKMKDWRIFTTWEWNEARMKYTTDKQFLMNLLNVPRLDVPELLIDGHDAGKRFEVWNNGNAASHFPTRAGQTRKQTIDGIKSETSWLAGQSELPAQRNKCQLNFY